MTGWGSDWKAYEMETPTEEGYCDCGNKLNTDEEKELGVCEDCK